MKPTVVEIQKRVDAFPAKMNAKGIAKPSASFRINANESLSVDAHWYVGESYSSKFMTKHFKGNSPEKALAAFEAWIESLPSIEEARRAEFMSALASVIELGKGSGIEVDFVNPLVETMKRLSENVITDQREAA